ncbi:MAG: DegT/DnrJ/EryC1/StrS family aminotransferase [Acidobacteria bacterium]|nr:DegT/DnrJ/EryC1/StrS family aminotransferase [Acidobacteriota bacterium]
MISISKLTLDESTEEAVLRVLRTGQLAMGQETVDVENAFSKRFDGAQCIAVSNGTVGITLALAAMGVGPGDEVITTSFSFIGTIEPIIQLGAIPIFADIDVETSNISVEEIKSLITDKTKVILPVHLYGRPVDLVEIRKIAVENGIYVLEDACQAIGAQVEGIGEIGSTGTSVFSFYGSKNIACGEGGLVVTDDPSIAERVKLLRSHGSIETYKHQAVGYNGRMTDLQAAILRVQFEKIDTVTMGRRGNAQYFNDSILNENIVLPPFEVGASISCFHQYTLRLENRKYRDDLQNWAHLHEVETRAYYPYTLSGHPVVKELGFGVSCKNAEILANSVLSIPVRESLSLTEKEHIAEVLSAWQPHLS